MPRAGCSQIEAEGNLAIEVLLAVAEADEPEVVSALFGGSLQTANDRCGYGLDVPDDLEDMGFDQRRRATKALREEGVEVRELLRPDAGPRTGLQQKLARVSFRLEHALLELERASLYHRMAKHEKELADHFLDSEPAPLAAHRALEVALDGFQPIAAAFQELLAWKPRTPELAGAKALLTWALWKVAQGVLEGGWLVLTCTNCGRAFVQTSLHHWGSPNHFCDDPCKHEAKDRDYARENDVRRAKRERERERARRRAQRAVRDSGSLTQVVKQKHGIQ